MAERKTLKAHVEIIIGVFLVGTLAFIVASSWNKLLAETLEWLKDDTNFIGTKGHGMIAYSAIYAVFITLVSIVILAILINFEYINHNVKYI